MSGPMYGGPKVAREPLRPVLERARILPGRQVEKVGNQMQRIGRMWESMLEDREKEKQLLQANERLGEMMQDWRQNYAPKVMTRMGANAIGATGSANEALDYIMQERGQDLSPWASDQLTARWQRFTDSELAGVADWESKQTTLASETKKVDIGNQWLEAISHNPTLDTTHAAIQEFSATLVADLLPTDDIRDFPRLVLQLRDYEERAYSMQIGALIRNGDINKAEKLLEEYGTAPEAPEGVAGLPEQNAIIGAKSRATLEGLLKAKKAELQSDTDLVEEQAAADSAVEKYDGGKGSTLAEARQGIRDKYSGAMEDNVMTRFNHRVRMGKDDQVSQEQAAMSAAAKELRDIIPPGPGPMTIEMEKRIHELRKTIPSSLLPTYDKLSQQLLLEDPITVATTAAANEWIDLSADEMLAMTVEEFAARFETRLNTRVWYKAQAEHRELLAGGDARKWKERVKDHIDGLLGGKTDAMAKEKRVNLKGAYDEEKKRREKIKGSPLNGPQMDAIFTDFAQESLVRGWRERLGLDEFKETWGTDRMPYHETFFPGNEGKRATWRNIEIEAKIQEDPQLNEYIEDIYIPVFREVVKRPPTPGEIAMEAKRVVREGYAGPAPKRTFPTNHPTVANPDGSVSNVRMMSVTYTGDDGVDTTYVIPTMVEGKPLERPEAIAIARSHGLRNYPSFKDVPEAEAWIQANHGKIRP